MIINFCKRLMVFVYISVVSWTICADEITEGFSFSSPDFEGQSKWKVEGDRVQFLPNDLIEIVPLRAVIITEEGKVYRIFSDWAHFDRRSQIVHSKAKVEVFQGASKMQGIGFHWEPKGKKLSVLSHVDLWLDIENTQGLF